MPELAPRLRAALFDLDGTLVHTAIDFARMKREVLMEAEARGLPAGELRERDILAIIREAAARLDDPEEFAAACERRLVAVELAGCEGAALAEGAAETLEWLRMQGVRVGIVTRNSPQAIARLAPVLRLPHEVLLTRHDTPRVKPDPLHMRLALARLEVPAEAAVMVGDHLMDVLGGRAAGMRTVGVLLPERPPDYFREAAPDLVIRSLPELRPWISP